MRGVLPQLIDHLLKPLLREFELPLRDGPLILVVVLFHALIDRFELVFLKHGDARALTHESAGRHAFLKVCKDFPHYLFVFTLSEKVVDVERFQVIPAWSGDLLGFLFIDKL